MRTDGRTDRRRNFNRRFAMMRVHLKRRQSRHHDNKGTEMKLQSTAEFVLDLYSVTLCRARTCTKERTVHRLKSTWARNINDLTVNIADITLHR